MAENNTIIRYETSIGTKIIGALLKNSFLLADDRYAKLEKKDFSNHGFGNEMHRIIFQLIYRCYRKNIGNITYADISDRISESESEWQEKTISYLKDNDYEDFLNHARRLGTEDNFDSSYQRLKCLSLLRKYELEGFNVSNFVNDEGDVVQSVKVENGDSMDLSVSYINNYFEGIIANLRNKNEYSDIAQEVRLNKTGLDEMIDIFKSSPAYGYSTFSDQLNSITRGYNNGQMTCISCPTGAGKTTIACKTIADLGAKAIWDYTKCKFVKNPHYCNGSVLLIQFEMAIDTEVSPRILGAVAGIPTSKILDGDITPEEEARLRMAADIVEASDINVVLMPSFSPERIRNIAKAYRQRQDRAPLKMLVFDYIQSSAASSKEYAKAMGDTGKEYQIMQDMSAKLKDIAVEFGIPILTFTQTNSAVNTQKVLDSSVISGSKGVATKLDVGIVMTPIRDDEKAIIDTQIEGGIVNDSPDAVPPSEVNRILHIYKVRFGASESSLKIWGKLDLGTGRWQESFITDRFNETIKHTGHPLVTNKILIEKKEE